MMRSFRQKKTQIKTQVNDTYSKDQDCVSQSFKFCEESDKLIENNEQQIDEEKYEPEDVLLMNEMRKISKTVLSMLKKRS